MEIDQIPITEIIPYAKNPRKNDQAVDIVVKSIKEFGFRNPIILDKTNEIIAGHTRLLAAKKLGFTEVPVIWAEDLTKEQVKAYRLMDNKSAEYSNWDWDLLKGEFEGLTDLSITGFTEAEIDKIMNPDEKFSVGDKDPKYKISLGEAWKLGNHTLVCGDSTDQKTYELLLPKGTDINLVFTDPPYGVSYSGTNNPNGRDWNVIEGDDLRGDKLAELLYGCFEQINEHLIKDGALYVFHSSSNQIIFEQALNKAGFKVKQQLIWHKHHILGHSHYHWCHEPIFYANRINENPKFYGTRTNKTTISEMDIDTMHAEDMRRLLNKIKRESTIWEIKKDSTKNYIHPTQKPIKLAERAIINSSKVQDNVLDPFGGSGSTLMACEQRNRNCFMIELDPVFCSHIIERWENQTGNKGELLKLHK